MRAWRVTGAAQRCVPAAQGGRKSSDGAGAAVGGVALAAAQAIAAGKKVAPASDCAAYLQHTALIPDRHDCLECALRPQVVHSCALCACSTTLSWTLQGRKSVPMWI